MKKKYPEAEVLIASDFSCREKKRYSQLAPGARLAPEYDRYYCPRCRKRSHRLPHGVTKQCKCGLLLTVYGNALHLKEGTQPPPELKLVEERNPHE